MRYSQKRTVQNSAVRLLLTMVIMVVFTCLAPGQTTQTQTTQEEAKATEFAIPVSPAFALMGADPSLVSMPGVIRDFKVDWSFRTYKLSPNISVEAQPIWLIFYEKPDLKRYRKASAFMRQLSTLSLSFGTIQLDTTRLMAYAFKINLFRARDPLIDSAYVTEGMQDFNTQYDALKQQITVLQSTRDTSTSEYQKISLENQILAMENQLIQLQAGMRNRIKELRDMYLKSYWNTSCVDFAFGRSFTYVNPSLDSLDLASRGYGAWITGGVGVGRKIFISGILKYLKLDEFSDSRQTGINFRYGTNRFRFFVEGVYDNLRFEGVNALNEDINRTTENYTIAYGGDLRLGNNVILSFGLRTVYDTKMNFVNLLPVANIGCMMR